METLVQDVRFGTRRLVKSPGFTIIAIISLALGVGANTAIFSLVNTVLLRPLPVERPQEMVALAVRGKDDSMNSFSYPNYLDFRDRNEVLSGIFVERFSAMNLTQEDRSQFVWGHLVSGNYFDVLGVHAIKGRTFLPEEDRTKLSHPVAVLSYSCWQKRFGGDPEIVGRKILLNQHPFEVIGIAPEGFRGINLIYTAEIWVPMNMLSWIEPGNNWLDNRSSRNVFAIGRLKPGVSVRQAQESLGILNDQLIREYPDANEGQTIKLFPPGLTIPDLHGPVISSSWVLMGAVGLVLLIACTNLAGLLLARGAGRRREIAIRLALGASRTRLIRQLMTESVLLSLAGGVLGLVLAAWMTFALAAFKPPVDFPLTIELAVDWRVMVFALMVSAITGILFGLMPALQATKPDLVGALKDSSSQAGLRKSWLRSGLVVAQFAFSLIFLIGAGLCVRALQQIQTMNPGFDIRNRLTMSFDLALQGYDEARGKQFHREVIEKVQELPGVRSAALTTFVPLSLSYSSNGVQAEGKPAERGANVESAMTASVGIGYFETMGVSLLAGREFTEQDTENSMRVTVVNETFAKKFFPELGSAEEVVGKRVSFTWKGAPFMQIVGVIRDGKYFNIAEEPRSFMALPMLQDYSTGISLVVRTAGDPGPMTAVVQKQVQSLDSRLMILGAKTMSEHMGLSLFPARVVATILGGFGLLALILAAIGIYGITSYSVAQRTREIGIRMALGADRGRISRLIVRHGMVLAGTGLAIGLVMALMVTKFMSSLLLGVSPTDPLTYFAIPVVLALVALAACLVPAGRATKVDPMIALRWE
jgi:predicted permease